MKPTVFLDTNILLRHVLQDDPEQSPKASAFLASIEEGRVAAATSDTVVFEAVFVLERHYHHPRERIRDALLPLLELPGISLSRKRGLRRVFELCVGLNIPFADAYHAVLMQHLKVNKITTFDRDFDRIPGITRIRL